MRYAITILVATFIVTSKTYADEQALTDFIGNFDYDTRVEMKASAAELVDLLQEGEAQLVDIRFKEEYEVWHMGVGDNIPLNELPERLNELDKDKIIVTACPHKDRAIIAMTYLRAKGYKTMYLKDGLIGLAELLRGDNAKDFIEDMSR